jgi:hypothetical protein
LHPKEEGVYILYDNSGSLWAYGPAGISNRKYIVEGTLERTERGLSVFIERVIPA